MRKNLVKGNSIPDYSFIFNQAVSYFCWYHLHISLFVNHFCTLIKHICRPNTSHHSNRYDGCDLISSKSSLDYSSKNIYTHIPTLCDGFRVCPSLTSSINDIGSWQSLLETSNDLQCLSQILSRVWQTKLFGTGSGLFCNIYSAYSWVFMWRGR